MFPSNKVQMFKQLLSSSSLVAAYLSLASAGSQDSTPVGTIGTVTRQETVQKLSSGSELVALYSEPAYVNPIYVLSLHGETSFNQGYDAGYLFGKQIETNYNSLFMSLFKDVEKLEPALKSVTEMFLDWQVNIPYAGSICSVP